MCDVKGETRVLPSPKLLRPSCDERSSDGSDSPSRSTPCTPTGLRRASSLEKCFSDPEFFKKQRARQQQHQQQKNGLPTGQNQNSNGEVPAKDDVEHQQQQQKPQTESQPNGSEVITNGGNTSSRNCGTDTNGGAKEDECDGPANGKDTMAPVLNMPPPPPPAPHMGPDGLILPRKPYNPCLTSNSHKDLHRELLFNQKVGKNVLNQKSELQRALERHREMVSRKEAEKNQEESYKSDPRTALQRAIEQRAKHIQKSQQPQTTEPPNPLATARAKLRSRIDSQ